MANNVRQERQTDSYQALQRTNSREKLLASKPCLLLIDYKGRRNFFFGRHPWLERSPVPRHALQLVNQYLV